MGGETHTKARPRPVSKREHRRGSIVKFDSPIFLFLQPSIRAEDIEVGVPVAPHSRCGIASAFAFVDGQGRGCEAWSHRLHTTVSKVV